MTDEKPARRAPIWKPWGEGRIRNFIDDVRGPLRDIGADVGLTGSCLYRGCSDKDLDLIVYPLDSSKPPTRQQIAAVFEALAMRRRLTVGEVQSHWRGIGSNDEKAVEVWSCGSRRVDVFYLS